jgi:hypothetical protein
MKNIAEHTFTQMCDKKFGTNLKSRFFKLKEEFEELEEALNEYLEIPSFGQSEQRLAHLKDETSDLYSVLSHFAHLLGLYQAELLEMSEDKVKGREIDPNYKRERPKCLD